MRILLCAFDSPGHLYPMIGLALELKGRGHDVGFVTSPDVADTVRQHGLGYIDQPPSDRPSFQLKTWFFPKSVARATEHLGAGVDGFGPDVLVGSQLCLAASAVSEMTGLPLAVLGSFTYLWSKVDPQRRRMSPNGDEERRRWRRQETGGVCRKVRNYLGLPDSSVTDGCTWLCGDVLMLRTAPELEPDWDDPAPRIEHIGPALWEPVDQDVQAWRRLSSQFLLPEAPLVYVQPGRAFDGPGFWDAFLEAVNEQDVQIVAATGRMDSGLGTLPPNVIAGDDVRLGVVLPWASAVVSSGTSSPVLGALTHGLPSVVIPCGGETPDNAARLAEAGAAVVIDATAASPEALWAGLTRALSDVGLREASQRAQAAMERYAGFGRAAAVAESLIEVPQSESRARHQSARD